MRFSLAYFKRSAQVEKKVPYRPLTPLTLKDYVSGKSVRLMEKGCIQELANFLTCLRENEFNNANCPKEFLAFKKCNDQYLKKSRELKAMRDKEKPEPYAKQLTHKQVTYFLKTHPIR